MITLYILFCLYASISGMKDAILYGKQGAETFKWNEHILFNLERATVLSLMAQALFVKMDVYGLMVLTGSCILSFSLFHNGFYLESARQINRPDYHFYSNSQTSTAPFEITWNLRLFMFILSIAALITYHIVSK